MTEFTKYLENDLFIEWVKRPTHENKMYWNNYIKKHPKEKDLINEVREFIIALETKDAELNAFEKRQLLGKLTLQKATIDKKAKRLQLIRNITRYAAAVVITIGLGATYNYMFKSEVIETLMIDEEVITLMLDDGTIKEINEKGEEQIVNNNGEVLGKQKGIQLIYQNNKSIEKLVYNQLNVPFGKKVEILLSDGTQVYLNAGSTLRYPVKFLEGLERKVFLTGEAFFDVTKNMNNSFIVNVDELDIRVFGTKFNVTSYREDENISTVLVEGSVGIYSSKEKFEKNKGAVLIPGELGAWDKNKKKLAVNKVDTSIYTSWIEGKLIFRKTPFKTICRKLERKYNVTIKSNNKELDSKLYNAVFKSETIEEILNSFQKNYNLNYSIVENKIRFQ